MKRRIAFGLIILIFFIFLFIIYKIRPSYNIDNYSSYYINDSSHVNGNGVKVTFFGVSTLLFDDGETQILFDGFFSRSSMMHTLLAEIESDTALIDNLITSYKMDSVKGIFVTHSHYDHAFDVAYTCKRTGATLYGSLSTLNIARGGAVREEQLSLFQPYKNIQLGKFTVQVIPSKHSSNSALKDEGLIIDKPIRQPVKMKTYVEGGSYDFLIRHNGKSIYVKPSPNYILGALDSLKADVVFIGIATIGKQTQVWQDEYYEQTVGALKPAIVIPVHWDDFFHPISNHLVMLPRFVNDAQQDFDFFIRRTKADHIEFKILQGTKSVIFFKE